MFINLHNHTHFSLLQSLISPKDLLLKAKELNQNSIAITDYGTLAGIWDGFKASKETGIKLIVGCNFYFVNDVSNKNTKLRYIILIAKNYTGYKNLLSLNKEGFDNASLIGKRVLPVIDWASLSKYYDGLICLTACGNGITGQLINNKKFDEAESAFLKLKDIFGDNLGAEVQAHNLVRNATYFTDPVNQVFTNAHTIRLANKHNIRIVPTSNSHYLKKNSSESHDVLLAIGSMQPVYSNARIKYDISDLYPKSYDEIKAFFTRNHPEEFVEHICKNSVYFADLCERPDWVDPKFSNPSGKELPIFPVEKEPDFDNFKNWWSKREELKGCEIDGAYLRFKCEGVLKTKIPYDKYEQYQKRLEKELDVFNYCNVNSYMLIVADIINWSRKSGIPTGCGRGSGGGSIAAYFLGIHLADPIKYGLVFERFFSKLRESYADIDSDFSKERRDEVLNYIKNKYGEDKFAQITNVIYITPKVYVRDISRACELAGDRKSSVQLGNEIADIIPKKDMFDKEVRTYQDMIKASPLYVLKSKEYPKLEKYSAICGKPRANGIHAAGVIISNRPINQITPLRLDKDNILSTQLDKNGVEEIGLVKMDILGVETLDIIDQTNKLIAKQSVIPNIDYEEYDKKTYDLITSGNTYGVFQFGTSAGTIDLCRRIEPKSIEDLAIITTLARPASKGIRNEFIEARQTKTMNSLFHKSLESSLKDTFGFPLYDESLLVLAKDVAGWELDEADKLRKLTKEKGKNPEKAEKWRQDFIKGAIKNKVEEKIAVKIWHDIIEPFGRYSFNKSHAVLYSMISYHTAYLKAHYPIEFLLANLISEIKSNSPNADRNIEKIKQELRNHNVNILPPDINKSGISYELLPSGELLTGFEALKSVGDDAIQEIISKRPFINFDDFMLRVNSAVRSNTIQALVASGCFDNFNICRKTVFLYCSDYRKKIQVWLKKHDPSKEKFEYVFPKEKNWSISELYALEKSYLGEAFICKNSDAYIGFFNNKSTLFSEIKTMVDRDQIKSVRAIVKDIFEFKVKKENSKYIGEYMIKATIEDECGSFITLTIFPTKWKEVKERIRKLYGSKYKFDVGVAIHFSATVNVYEDELGIVLENLFDFAPPPSLPKDFKVKKTIETKKVAKKSTEDILSININNTDDILYDIEDQLIDEGLLDLNEFDDENYFS